MAANTKDSESSVSEEDLDSNEELESPRTGVLTSMDDVPFGLEEIFRLEDPFPKSKGRGSSMSNSDSMEEVEIPMSGDRPHVEKKEMSEEQLANYRRQALRSEGFDIDPYPKNTVLCGGIRPLVIREERCEALSNFCKEALIAYNDNSNDGNYEFVRVVKANHQAVAGKMYYITFEAKHRAVTSNQTRVTFQVKIWEKLFNEGMQVMLCRKKP